MTHHFRPTLLILLITRFELVVVASYFDDDAMVSMHSVRSHRSDFRRDAELWYNMISVILLFCYLFVSYFLFYCKGVVFYKETYLCPTC